MVTPFVKNNVDYYAAELKHVETVVQKIPFKNYLLQTFIDHSQAV